MKRILALHGHAQSSSVIKKKLTAITRELEDEIEFVYIDAPHYVLPVDPPNISGLGWTSEPDTFELDASCAIRAWWLDLYGMTDSHSAIESLHYMRRILEEQGPFDGIIGFSQGATLAALLTGYLEYSNINPKFACIDHPPFSLGIFISGYIAQSPATPLPKIMRTPSLHIIGVNDVVVLPQHSKDLSRRFSQPRVEIHEGGHWIPRKPSWRRFFINYLTAWVQDVVGPSRSDTSSPTAQHYRTESEDLDDEELGDDSEGFQKLDYLF
ncbi:hypothetical protein BD410DRAFT_794926 [Rickenella mellea]|uniref:Serine hydrolase domain-containing protein n=1 Tax=Rickenella mellea TaxID=50990 RepID=A0A4Y7PNX8_9AGAM|nr:hypothetical protein BD410DRAFT_794926 [Rickenella mellea]